MAEPAVATGVSSTNLRFPTALWIAAFAALSVWVAHRLGAFDLWRMVTLPDGERMRMPAGFATVDHPFHSVRAELLRRSLASGHPLRWMGQHQGGYPAEFYPFGAALLDLVGWVATLGLLPMAAVHKLAVIGLFLLPGAAYVWMARRDRLSLAVAAIAMAGEIAVRGWWWSGGGRELVEWGLFTNVAAATILLFAIPAGASLLDGSRRAVAVLGLIGAWGILANPRSAIALAAIAGGMAITWKSSAQKRSLKWAAMRAAVAGAIAVAVAAPLLIPLVRFNHLYVFVHYSGYADLRAYLDSSIQATATPLFVLGAIGLLAGLVRPAGSATAIAAWTLLGYVVLTVYFVAGAWPAPLIQQLETTRLMPFQRYLWLYFAGYALVRGLGWLADRTSSMPGMVVDGGGLIAAGIVLTLYVWAPPSFIPVSDRGLVAVPDAAQTPIADLERAVQTADAAAPAGTALLVLGTTVSWHDGLWAPLWSDRRFYFDDWLWYWQTRNYGDYDPLLAHAYRNDASALERDYLDHHSIGAVIVTGPEAKPVAPSVSYLHRIRSGIYDVYLVDQPTGQVASGGTAFEVTRFDDRRIVASGVADGQSILVRHNWFPRWRATVNGQPAAVTETDDGYMRIAAPAGPATLELVYAVDRLDWLARAICVAGVALAVVWLLPIPGRSKRRAAGTAPLDD